MRSFFPDVNVWVALAYGGHQHHAAAASWFEEIDAETAFFCRMTQLSFLRLLTHPPIMGEDVKSQVEAWEIYDAFLSDARISFLIEPDLPQLESKLRSLTKGEQPPSTQWPDAYLAAFAQTADLILVTFDRGLHQTARPNSLLLS
jgi:uncharacterized protein